MFNYAALTDLRQLIRDDKETDSLFFVPYATILPLRNMKLYLSIIIISCLATIAAAFFSHDSTTKHIQIEQAGHSWSEAQRGYSMRLVTEKSEDQVSPDIYLEIKKTSNGSNTMSFTKTSFIFKITDSNGNEIERDQAYSYGGSFAEPFFPEPITLRRKGESTRIRIDGGGHSRNSNEIHLSLYYGVFDGNHWNLKLQPGIHYFLQGEVTATFLIGDILVSRTFALPMIKIQRRTSR